jgi:signal transduction histidine kinase
VRDNGAGIDDITKTELFTPFTRLETRRIEGHGLGLSIVRQIVEKLGGEVGAESSKGLGSRFYFTLPSVVM